ncbi:FAD:protein FMN transferase [bacterium]|nr:FAD:protein FMN transferase [bacterium]
MKLHQGNPDRQDGVELENAELEYYEGLERAMGTVIRLHAFYPHGERAWMYALADSLFDTVLADDHRLSIYKADSPLSRLNRAAGGEPVVLDPDTFELLAACVGWWKLTGGLFDITAGALMKKHGFHQGAALPKEDGPLDADSLRALIGCDKLELNRERLTARLARPGMLIDLGGVAKGWSVEAQARMLSQAGLKDFVISAGTSTVAARGAPPGEAAWPMELEGLDDHSPAHSLSLTDCAVSVSGNFRNTISGAGGKVLRHIMNPLTLEPVEEIRQVIVSGPDAAECEALSTAFLIQGAESGVFSLEARDDIGLSILKSEGR